MIKFYCNFAYLMNKVSVSKSESSEVINVDVPETWTIFHLRLFWISEHRRCHITSHHISTSFINPPLSIMLTSISFSSVTTIQTNRQDYHPTPSHDRFTFDPPSTLYRLSSCLTLEHQNLDVIWLLRGRNAAGGFQGIWPRRKQGGTTKESWNTGSPSGSCLLWHTHTHTHTP